MIEEARSSPAITCSSRKEHVVLCARICFPLKRHDGHLSNCSAWSLQHAAAALCSFETLHPLVGHQKCSFMQQGRGQELRDNLCQLAQSDSMCLVPIGTS